MKKIIGLILIMLVTLVNTPVVKADEFKGGGATEFVYIPNQSRMGNYEIVNMTVSEKTIPQTGIVLTEYESSKFFMLSLLLLLILLFLYKQALSQEVRLKNGE